MAAKLNKDVIGGLSRAIVDNEKIKQLDMRCSQLIENVSNAILVINPRDYTIVMANRALLEGVKMKIEDVIGKTCYEVTHNRSTPCSPPNDICPIKVMMETGRSVDVEHIHYNREGNKFYVGFCSPN